MSKMENVELWEENRAFFQANTVKGGRYLDDSGKIINEYADAYYNFTVDLNGLRFDKPKKEDMPDEIVVDMNRVWIACYGQGCIKKVTETSEAITKVVSRNIAVDSYSRLGLRVFYYKPAKDVKGFIQSIYPMVVAPELRTVVGSGDKVSEVASRIRFIDPPFSILLGIQPIVVSRPSEKRSDFTGDGVIIDIDVFENKDSGSRPLNQKHLAVFLRESSNRVLSKAKETIAFLRTGEKNARGS